MAQHYFLHGTTLSSAFDSNLISGQHYLQRSTSPSTFTIFFRLEPHPLHPSTLSSSSFNIVFVSAQHYPLQRSTSSGSAFNSVFACGQTYSFSVINNIFCIAHYFLQGRNVSFPVGNFIVSDKYPNIFFSGQTVSPSVPNCGGGWVYHLFIYLFISAGVIEW